MEDDGRLVVLDLSLAASIWYLQQKGTEKMRNIYIYIYMEYAFFCKVIDE